MTPAAGKHGGTLRVAQPHAAATRQDARDAAGQTGTEAVLVEAQQTGRGKQRAAAARGTEEDGVELVVHADAPDVGRDAGALGGIEQVEAGVGVVGETGGAAPDVRIVRAGGVGEAIQRNTGETIRRNGLHAQKRPGGGVGRRDRQRHAGKSRLEHLHDARENRFVADVVASERDTAEKDFFHGGSSRVPRQWETRWTRRRTGA